MKSKTVAGKMARKTFAKTASLVMKKPAMSRDVDEVEDQEEAEETIAMKRPAAGAAMKRPAAAGKAEHDEEGEENEGDGEEAEETPELSVEQLHRSSMRDAASKRRAIERLERLKQAIAAKMKNANSQIRNLQKELESSESMARKH